METVVEQAYEKIGKPIVAAILTGVICAEIRDKKRAGLPAKDTDVGAEVLTQWQYWLDSLS